jgi:hypothetical protein
MVETFFAHGFLLSGHDVFGRLALDLFDGLREKEPRRWTIVCERKEDLLAVRTQIFSLLNQLCKKENPESDLKTWAGISLYTPDTLVKNFILTMSHNPPALLGNELHTLFNRPFIDIVEQEKLMRLLLLRLGYALSDVAPLAKQILTLADTPLPADESFLSLLLEVHSTQQAQKNITDIPDSSLRTICVAYQLAQKILASFARLQSFVGTYWTGNFQEHLRAVLEGDPEFGTFLVPHKFLSSPLLWIGAPEYCHGLDSYRPGNFQASVIDSLRNGLFEARKMRAAGTGRIEKSWWARTQINSSALVPAERSADVHIYGSYAALTETFSRLCADADPETHFLLGDLNKRTLNTVRSDGSGIHALTPNDFEQPTGQSSEDATAGQRIWHSPAADKIAELRSEFTTYWDRLSVFDDVINDALARYELSLSARSAEVSSELMLHRFFDGETYSFAVTDDVALLPPALSLIPSLSPAKKYFVLGPPHSPTAPSFHLRLLNAVFYSLRAKQVALEPIASEEAYRGYWQSILAGGTEVTFLLRTLSDLQDFPEYARPWHRTPVQFWNWSEALVGESPFSRWLGGNYSLHDPEWTRLLKTPTTADGMASLAVTAFEDYVECPLQFYWAKLHGISDENQPELQADSLVAGQRSHAVAEKLIRGLRTVAILGETAHAAGNNSWMQMFADLQSHFISDPSFLSAEPEHWMKGLLSALAHQELTQVQQTHARVLAEELSEILFSFESGGRDKLLSPMKRKLVRETVRRAFKKLIDSELLDSGRTQGGASDSLATKAAFIEEGVRFTIHPKLVLKGQIDRIDSHPEGDRIIDYKTSKVAAKEPLLVLNPEGLKTKEKLSVQGAIYSLAWARRLAESQGEEATRGVSAFSLLHLKTLDLSREPYLTCRFSSPLIPAAGEFETLNNIYSKHAHALVEGDFTPRPVTKGICQWCPFESICPSAGRTHGELS